MRNRGVYLLFAVLLAADQLTKHLALSRLTDGEPVSIIPGFFDLMLVMNPGAAFGMFGSLPDTTRRTALFVVSLIALVVVFRFMFKEARHDRISMCALAAILAGAVGNIVDRFRFDAVVDFLDFYWNVHHWPAFNIADSGISVGVAVLVLRMLLGKGL